MKIRAALRKERTRIAEENFSVEARQQSLSTAGASTCEDGVSVSRSGTPLPRSGTPPARQARYVDHVSMCTLGVHRAALIAPCVAHGVSAYAPACCVWLNVDCGLAESTENWDHSRSQQLGEEFNAKKKIFHAKETTRAKMLASVQ